MGLVSKKGSRSAIGASLVLVALLLIPSAVFLAGFSDLPRFGQVHDDSLYFVSAKSLAQGHGYRIESLPGAPAQTKYPPLYPLLLSIAWRVVPQFPANLAWAGWLSWLALPVVMLELVWLIPMLGFSRRQTWVVLALFGLNPYVILLSTQILTELWFLALVLAAVLILENAVARASARAAAAAGAIAGLAYLTRSAGIALFLAAIFYLWRRKQSRLIGYFCAAAAPFVVGWMAWVAANRTPTNDPELIYYIDYFRYQLYAISWWDLPMVLWKNADGFIWGLGGLILPKLTDSLLLKILAQVIAVAMISGVVRLVRRGSGELLAAFAAASTLMLLVWSFPANERFVLPLFPLTLAGLIVETGHFAALLRGALKHPDRSQRVVAMGMAAFVGSLAAGVLALQVYVWGFYLPDDARHHQAARAAREAVYAWVAANTPVDSAVLSEDDVMLYLNTGRHAMRRPVPPFLWYRQDHTGMVAWLGQPEEFAQQHGLTYLDFAGVDVSLGVDEDDTAAIARKIHSSPALNPLFTRGDATFYAIRAGQEDPHTAALPPAQ